MRSRTSDSRPPARPGAGAGPCRRGVRAAALLCLAAASVTSAQEPPRAAGGLTLEEVIRTTLRSGPEVRLARWETRAAQGALRQAQGAFDVELAAGAVAESQRIPTLSGDGTPGIERTTGVRWGLSADRRFRSGIGVTPELTMTRLDAGGDPLDARNEAFAGLGVVLPLLRGRGGGLATAVEAAAARGWRASEAEARHAGAGAVLRAVAAYWGYVAATGRQAVLLESEARAARLVEDTRRLVEADERPAVDLVPAQASLASRRAARIAGEEAVAEARRALLLEMGSPAEALATLPPPATPFPADAAVDPAAAPAPEEAAARARAARADVAAALLRREGAEELLRGARRELRPRLDLDLGLGYRGLESGGAPGRLVTPFYSPLGGPQASVGVTYAFPLRNRAAEGAAIVSEAAYRQAEVLAEEAARAAALDAATAAETLRRSAEEVRVAAEAVRLHAAAVEGERQKFRLGTATLFDVLFAEDNLSAAELAEVDARRRHATALARLRYETGALSGVEGAEAEDAAALAGRAAPR